MNRPAVLFDLLSALLDSWALWDDIAGSRERGRTWRLEYLRRCYRTGAYVPYLDLVADAAAAVGLPRRLAGRMESRWGELRPWPGAGRVLSELARDRPLGVVTNCSEELGHRAADLVGAPFEAVVTAEAAGCYKPDPRIYRAGVEALNRPAEDVLFVAGSPGDVEGAGAAGMRVVWHNPARLEGDAAKRIALAVIDDLQSLPQWLGARPSAGGLTQQAALARPALRFGRTALAVRLAPGPSVSRSRKSHAPVARKTRMSALSHNHPTRSGPYGQSAAPLALTALPLLASLAACVPESSPGDDVALDTDAQRASYAIGRNMAASLEDISDQIDSPALLRGLSDGIAGVAPALTQYETQAALDAFQQIIADAQTAAADAERAEGERFLADNADREGVVSTESGLQYEVLAEGDGASPEAGQIVRVHYRGTLTDGSEFDSSMGGDPATFSLDNVIPGFAEAIMLMKVGGRLKAYVPGDLAYAEAGRPGIPPNAVLVFEIELLGIQ